MGLGYTHVQNRGDHDEPQETYNEKALTDVSYNRPLDPERDVGLYNQLSVTAPLVPRERYEPRMEPVQAAGHAFPLAGVAADAPSRTMQLAYSDPCEFTTKKCFGPELIFLDAQVRASLMQSSQVRTPSPQQVYGQGGLPAPPGYGGYR